MQKIAIALLALMIASVTGFGQSSVLATGNWYRLGVNQTGVHALNYSDLQSLGIDPTTLVPDNIQLYGNGGGALPVDLADPRPTDLEELAIEIVGGNDGSFDVGDELWFYGESQTTWSYNTTDARWEGTANSWADATHYFLRTDGSNGKRVMAAIQPPVGPLDTIRDYDFRYHHELDAENLLRSGSQWLGELVEDGIIASVALPFPSTATARDASVVLRTVGQSAGSFDLTADAGNIGTDVATIPPISACWTCKRGHEALFTLAGTTSGTVNLELSVPGSTVPVKAWLDYVDANMNAPLAKSAGQLDFRSQTANNGSAGLYIVENAPAAVQVWDVSDHSNVVQPFSQTVGNAQHVSVAGLQLHEFVAFEAGEVLTPDLLGTVANQNLRQLSSANYIIIAAPEFVGFSNDLAQLHSSVDGFSTTVVTTEQIYNEFGGGVQDVSAIRDFIFWQINNATGPQDEPQSVLLFGAGSYDPKNRITGNTNFVPVWQNDESLSPTSSICSDDFYGWDGSGNFGNVQLPIAIGRLPATTLLEASDMVKKITDYYSVAGLGAWRNTMLFVGDNDDSSIHMLQSNGLAETADMQYCDFYAERLNVDQLPMTQGPDGPEAQASRDRLLQQWNEGRLAIFFTGHGGADEWTHEGLFQFDDIAGLNNTDRYPFVVAATTEFARFDNPEFQSGAEELVISPFGGAIASFASARISYSTPNSQLTDALAQVLAPGQGAAPKTLGEAVRLAKNNSPPSINTRQHVLIGDPAITLAYPKHHVEIELLDGNPISSLDSILPNANYTLNGRILDATNNWVTTFDGTLEVAALGPKYDRTTLGNFGVAPLEWVDWGDTLYTTTVAVVGGEFEIPLNIQSGIANTSGTLKFLFYASNGQEDANGCYEQLTLFDLSASVGPIAELGWGIQPVPNPSNGRFALRIDGEPPSDLQLSIHNSIGQQIRQERLPAQASHALDLNALSAGTYLVSVYSPAMNQRQRKTVIIQ